MIKAVPPLWSILFFLMMLALGFGSEVNINILNQVYSNYIYSNSFQ